MTTPREPIQLALFDGAGTPVLKRHTPAHRKAARSTVVQQLQVELKERRFLPVLPSGEPYVPTTPRSRSECAGIERPCNRLLCRHNLLREAAEDRAGRPGLANVPRGEMGRTLPIEGDLGDELPETTLRPVWAEYTWSTKAVLEWDENGDISDVHLQDDDVNGPNIGRWEAMNVSVGESLEVLKDGVCVAVATLTEQGLSFDRKPDAVMVTLRRMGTPPSCELDVIDAAKADGRRASTAMEVARAMGRSPSWVRKQTRGALVKVLANGATPEGMRVLLVGDEEE